MGAVRPALGGGQQCAECPVVIHETADPGVVIAEYGLDGELTESAEPFSLRFVMVMTAAAGTSSAGGQAR